MSLVGTYQSEQGSRLVKSLKRSIINLLPETTQFEFGIAGSKLSTHFQIKNKTIFEHNHDVVYLGTCREDHCLDNYVGKSARRISERIIDHSGEDQNSHFSSIVASKTTQILLRLTLRSLVVDLRAIIADEIAEKFCELKLFN